MRHIADMCLDWDSFSRHAWQFSLAVDYRRRASETCVLFLCVRASVCLCVPDVWYFCDVAELCVPWHSCVRIVVFSVTLGVYGVLASGVSHAW